MRINIPPLTRILIGLLLAISVTHQITRYIYHTVPVELLALVPQQSVFYPWVYVTATYAEQNVITLLIAGATILYGGKYLERAWGSTEFGKFVLIVTVLPNVASTIVYILWFVVTRDAARAYVRVTSNILHGCADRFLQGSLTFRAPSLFKEHSLSPSSSLFRNTRSLFSRASSKSASNISQPSSWRQTPSPALLLAPTQLSFLPGQASSLAGYTSDSTRDSQICQVQAREG